MKFLTTRMLFLTLLLAVVFMGGVTFIYAQDTTPEVTVVAPVPIGDQGDVVYDQTTSVLSLLLDRLPLLALVLLVLAYVYQLATGKSGADGYGDELMNIRQSKLFTDAERSYERIKTPASDMTFDTVIQILTAVMMIPLLPDNLTQGMQDSIMFLRDLKNGLDGDEGKK